GGATTSLGAPQRSQGRDFSPDSRASRASHFGQRKWTEANQRARSMYRLSLGSTMISSPSVTNGGTRTTTPFSSVAGLYDADAVAPRIIGCVSAILALTVFGSSTPSGRPS